MSESKRNHLKALSTENGIIAALAMDQRGALRAPLAKAIGVEEKQVAPEMMEEFKCAVVKVLTPYASAILLDPDYGLDAIRLRSNGTGLLVSYEKCSYNNTRAGKLPDLLDTVSSRRISEWGGNAVKILLHYTPFEKSEINEIKQAFIERVGAECEANAIPFFLEPIGYDETGADAKGFEFAKRKPYIVASMLEEFSKPRYRVDVLKVEIPINAAYMEGSSSYEGLSAYSRSEAFDHYRRAAAAARKPFIYLSAGVSNQQFVESLNMANEAGVKYSGVLCGRAVWQDGIPAYVKGGAKALEDWLSDEGVRNMQAVNQAIQSATAWHARI